MNKTNFNINILINNHKKKEKKKKEIFKLILNKCINHIIFTSKKNNKYCYYTIPRFLYGAPLYNITDCQKYIEKKLKKLRFEIKNENNKLFISWAHLI